MKLGRPSAFPGVTQKGIIACSAFPQAHTYRAMGEQGSPGSGAWDQGPRAISGQTHRLRTPPRALPRHGPPGRTFLAGGAHTAAASEGAARARSLGLDRPPVPGAVPGAPRPPSVLPGNRQLPAAFLSAQGLPDEAPGTPPYAGDQSQPCRSVAVAEGLANTGDGRPFCSAPAVMLTLITSHPGRIGGCTLKGFFKAHVDGGVLDRPAGGLQRTRDLSVRSEVQG